MSDLRQIVLVSDSDKLPHSVALFPKSDVAWANGSIPPEAEGRADAVAISTDAEWCAATTKLLAQTCKRVRWSVADLSQCSTNAEAIAALKAAGIHEFQVSAPQEVTGDVLPPTEPVEPAGADPDPSSPDEPPHENPPETPTVDFNHPAWADIPIEGAESPPAPFKRPPKRPRLAAVDGNLARAPDPEAEPLPAALSEDCLAGHFVDTYGENWRYVTEWDMWLQWRGDGWHRDKRNEVSDVLKRVTREALEWRDAQTLTPDGKRRINSKRTAWNSRDLAAADRRISILSDDLDADPFLLGVPGGVVDLKTGKLIEATPDQYITRRTAVPPEPGPHPLFDRVLARACGVHDDMREYLIRWFGYFLTGDVREEAFVFLHGPGGSGKSTLIKCITEIMGDYAVAISMDAFVEQKHPRHSQEIAKLAGMRLVFASETDEGRRWNEALIKALTGRDKITAHKMRMDDFEFDPTFKLLLFGNSIPHLKSVGEEIKRRIHLIEYAGSLTAEERDNTLKDRIKGEYPAILATMIRGCVDWQDMGLGKPESVSVSVDEYLEGEDSLAMFLSDCIETDRSARENSGDLYRRYTRWAAAAGEYVMSQKRLVSSLKQRGFEPQRSGGLRLISGLRLRPSEPDYPPPAPYHSD